MLIEIKTFAKLKDYFGESFFLEVPDSSSLEEILEKLILQNPKSKPILDFCLLANSNEMINRNYIPKDKEEILIMPPAGGG